MQIPVLTNVTRHDNCFIIIEFCLPWILVYTIQTLFSPANKPQAFTWCIFIFSPLNFANSFASVQTTWEILFVKPHFLQDWKIPIRISVTLVQFFKILAFKTINLQTSLLTWFLQGEGLVKCIYITRLAEKYYCCQLPIDIWKNLIV